MGTTLDAVIYQWIKGSLEPGFPTVPIIRENQSGPRPSGAFVSFSILGEEPGAFYGEDREALEGGEAFRLSRFRRVRVAVSVSAYAENGREILDALAFGNTRWQVRKAMKDARVAFSRLGTVRSIPIYGDTEFRPHFQADAEFLAWTTITTDEDRVLDLELSGEARED